MSGKSDGHIFLLMPDQFYIGQIMLTLLVESLLPSTKKTQKRLDMGAEILLFVTSPLEVVSEFTSKICLIWLKLELYNQSLAQMKW